MWRIFNKKNRTYTIAGSIAFIIVVYVVYRYVLPVRFKAWVKSFVISPADAVLSGVGSPGWEEQTRGHGPISAGEGPGLSKGSPIDLRAAGSN